jgi:hypothetical protein
LTAGAGLLFAGADAFAQDMQPRRWTRLPVDTNVIRQEALQKAGADTHNVVAGWSIRF